MKKIAVALVLALGVNVFACGGMTQVSPPSMEVDLTNGMGEPSGASALTYLDHATVIC